MTDIHARIREAAERYAALSPVDRAIVDTRQRQSWVRGEMSLGLDDGKGYTEEQIAAIPKDAAVVLADAVEELRGQLAAAVKRAEDAERQSERICGESYQAVSMLGEAIGCCEDENFIRLMDMLAYGNTMDGKELLPFPLLPNPLATDLAAAHAAITKLQKERDDLHALNSVNESYCDIAIAKAKEAGVLFKEAAELASSVQEELAGANATIAKLREESEWPNLEIDYTNWRGERAWRRVRLISVEWGSNEWHPQLQWLMHAIDRDTGQVRSFALAGMHSGRPVQTTPSETKK